MDAGIDNLLDDEEPDIVENSLDETSTLEHSPEIVEDSAEILLEKEPESINLDSLCIQATNSLSQGDAKGALQMLKEHLHGQAAQLLTHGEYLLEQWLHWD